MILSNHSISHLSRKRYIPPTAAGLNGLLKSFLLILACSGTVFLLLSCGKKSPSQADATAELAASFEGSPAKEDVIKANTALTEGRYTESLNLLHKVVGSVVLTERQKKAIAGIVGQLLTAVHEDPQLSKDTRIHRLMELLVRRTMGET
ncbi:MAG: hypothetical protein GY774_03040 [Planctomycetes bacterium]|nr:hypothetical protein [Planctomycetota bacterium]